MNKKHLIWIVGIIIVLSAVVTLAYLSADFLSGSNDETRFKGDITFIVDGKEQGSCYLDEPNMDIDDDFEQCLNAKYPGKTITNAIDWDSRIYKEVTVDGVDYRSFDQDVIDKLEESKLNIGDLG